MKLSDLQGRFGIDLGDKKCRLLRDADAAFYGNDKTRCLDAVTRLYELFDQEGEAA